MDPACSGTLRGQRGVTEESASATVDFEDQTAASIARDDVQRVFRWDLDKTYLRTEFDTFGNLLRTALQKAEEKQSVPGAPALMREIRAAGRNRISIISGSPRQMRRVLEQKLRLDRVEWDEFILKPNLSNLMRGRFRSLRGQVGYKLPALLRSRQRLALQVPEVLFGDDAEADAFIYSLYADLLAGRVDAATLEEVMEACDLYPNERTATRAVLAELALGASVERIFIHLERHTPPARFTPYGRRLVPIYNFFQAALVLFGERLLSGQAVLRVAAEMVGSAGYSLTSLSNSLQDLMRRGYAEVGALTGLADEVEKYASLFDVFRPARDIIEAFGRRIAPMAETRPASPPESDRLDYLALIDDARRR
jgi:hypothetical protein